MAKHLGSSTRTQQKKKPSPVYLQALRHFWRGENESALATVADALAEGNENQTELFYRLWIEVLAQENDEASLRILQEHLNREIDYKHPSWISFYALIGLIHYEIGELEAAQMVVKASRKHSANAYLKELQIVLDTEADDERLIQQSRGLVRQTSDYLHYRRSALLAHRAQKKTTLRNLFTAIEETFGTDPLANEIGFHESFASGNFHLAWQNARKLRDDFPMHADFQFYYAYASFKTERNQLALEQFMQLNRRFKAEDPDVLSMICASLLASSAEHRDKSQSIEIRQYLKRTVQRLSAMGLSAAYPLDILQRFEGSDNTQAGRMWLLTLSARQSVELYERPLERIDILHRALGEHVAKNDICFFISQGSQDGVRSPDSYRLIAIYRAVSQPQWHPLHRWFTALKLQIRMEVGIPFTWQAKPHSSTHRYGLQELDHETLAFIEDSIRNFTLEDRVYSHIVADLKTAGSL